MGLPWVRLDCAFPRNPKVLALLAEKGGRSAALVYLCGLAYSGEQGTDGFIPAEALSCIHGKQIDADLLARHQLWWPKAGGWQINGWDEKQESNAESQQRRKRAESLAAIRWNGHEPMTSAERARLYRERKKESNK